MNHRLLLTGLLSVSLFAGCASNATLEDTGTRSGVAARANTQLGIEYLRKGDYEMSLKKLQKALELEPDYAVAHDVIAVLYEQVGNNELAEKHYLRGLKLNPANADGHNNYGQFLCRTGRYREAEAEFLVAARDPFYKTPQLPLVNAGMCLEGVDELDKAETYFREALEKNPEYAPALLQMAKVSFRKQEYLKARAYLQRFQAVEKHTPESLWLGVRTEYALKDYQAGGNYALQLRNLHPDSKQAALLQEWENEQRSGN